MKKMIPSLEKNRIGSFLPSWLIRSLIFLIPLSLGGCGTDAIVAAVKSVFSLEPAKVWLERVSFHASDNVNDDSPVTVDIVIPYKEGLYEQLLKMDSDTYFRSVKQIKLDNAGQIDIFEWDIIRGQRLDNIPIHPSKVTGEGVLIFARYSSPGIHRVSLSTERAVTIQFDKLDFKVSPVTS